ncbi:MAG: BRCT domain-containing protein [Syntrophomonas sp.]
MSIRDYDSFDFRKYTIKGEIDKAIHTLEGLIKGIAIDGHINKSEIEELENWFNLNQFLLERHPFSELTQILKDSLANNYFSDDEKEDILWMCSQYSSQSLYYNLLTSDIQRLHGILHGILADNIIELREIEMLDEWLADNDHLTGLYPYDELCSLITVVLRDGRLTPDEINLLKAFFSEFIDTRQSYNLNEYELKEFRQKSNISGICAMCPQLVIPDKLYCFTGVSSKAKRTDIKKIIEDKGGKFKNSVVKDTDYLIVGNGGNPCWAFSCYGRKVEQAVNLRKYGNSILIVHENDFWDEIRNSDI